MNAVRFWALYALIAVVSYSTLRLQRFEVYPMNDGAAHFTVALDRWTGVISTGLGWREITSNPNPWGTQVAPFAAGAFLIGFLSAKTAGPIKGFGRKISTKLSTWMNRPTNPPTPDNAGKY